MHALRVDAMECGDELHAIELDGAGVRSDRSLSENSHRTIANEIGELFASQGEVPDGLA